MELNQVSTLKPENTACSIAGSGSGSNYTKIIGLLNDFQQELTQLTDKVNARDEVINTGTINAAKNITSAGTISAKDLTATGTLLIEGVANFTDIVVENDIQVKGSLLVDLFEIGDALINNLEVSTGTINSLISDIIKLKSELKRFDTNQNVISFPSPEETQIGDLANNVILAGLKKPKWNEEHLATEEFTALNYYNKEETEQREADELVDAIHRETDIIMGNTPVQRVAKGCVDTEGHLLATTDDAYMLSGAEGRDNIVARASLDDIKACGMYNVTKVDVANSITEKPTGEEGPFDLTVGYSLADKLKPYQLYVSHTTEKMYIRLSNVDNEFSSWQQFSFVGGSTRPADVGNPIINLKPEYDNEINFYGSNTSPILVFSGHGTNKNVFMFGKNASGELKAKKVMIDGKVACVQDEIKNFAFGAENIPLKAGDNLDTLPLGTYGTVDFSIFSQLLGDKPFNNPFKLFCFKGGVNEAKSKQQLAIEWNSESVALRHTQDGKLWTRWAQVSLKDSNGYVDKAKTADNLNSGAKLDGSPVATYKQLGYSDKVDLNKAGWYRLVSTTLSEGFTALIQIGTAYNLNEPSSYSFLVSHAWDNAMCSQLSAVKGATLLFDKIRISTKGNSKVVDIHYAVNQSNGVYASLKTSDSGIKIQKFTPVTADMEAGLTFKEFNIIPDNMAVNGVDIATKQEIKFDPKIGWNRIISIPANAQDTIHLDINTNYENLRGSAYSFVLTLAPSSNNIAQISCSRYNQLFTKIRIGLNLTKNERYIDIFLSQSGSPNKTIIKTLFTSGNISLLKKPIHVEDKEQGTEYTTYSIKNSKMLFNGDEIALNKNVWNLASSQQLEINTNINNLKTTGVFGIAGNRFNITGLPEKYINTAGLLKVFDSTGTDRTYRMQEYTPFYLPGEIYRRYVKAEGAGWENNWTKWVKIITDDTPSYEIRGLYAASGDPDEAHENFNTLTDFIDYLRKEKGGFRVGSVVIKQSGINGQWVNYLWIPHLIGRLTGDGSKFGTLFWTKMTTDSNLININHCINGVVSSTKVFQSTPSQTVQAFNAGIEKEI